MVALRYEVLKHEIILSKLDDNSFDQRKRQYVEYFHQHIFNSAGLKCFLQCDYKTERLPGKLASFHKQALLAWKMVYKHNFSPTRYYIWNNKNIQPKNKSLCCKKWAEDGIVLVKQLVDAEGQLLTSGELLDKVRQPISTKEYAAVFDAIRGAHCSRSEGQRPSSLRQVHSAVVVSRW